MRRAAAAVVAALALAACSEDEGSADELCKAVAESEVTAVFQGFDPTDRDSALDQLRTARVTLGDLHDAAPGEVRDDVQVEIAYVQALIDALEAVEPGDATEATLQIQAVTDAHPGIDEAAANLTAFAEEEC
ncbi:MAG: hypothetical protein ABWZ52_14175 [Acidimicrobiales bacterium]